MYCELKGAKVVDKAIHFPEVETVLEELSKALTQYKEIDVITLTANGEPTLYPKLDALVDGIMAMKKEHTLLILSNGSTIADTSMQKTLSKIDIVKLSLDCVSPECFKKLDRAHKSIDVHKMVEGMKAFRQRYHGELVIEILVVEGLNDTDETFKALNRELQHIKPNRIDVGTIDRPPAYAVKGVSVERLKELCMHLEGLHVNLAYGKHYTAAKRRFTPEEIVAMLRRRPQSFEDVQSCFDEQSMGNLEALIAQHVLHVKKIAGVSFYTCE